MTDVFISYAREDRAAAEAVATAIGNCGWNVWWDRRIAVGRSFSEAIEQELESARCVVVLWSRASVASEWVSNEAAEGARRRILVPIRIEDVTPPLEFRRLQTATLQDLERIDANPEFADCVAAIRGLMGESSRSPSAPAVPLVSEPVPDPPVAMPAGPNDGGRPWYLKAPSIGVAALVVLLALGLTRWNDRSQKTPEEPSAVDTAVTASSPATATEPLTQSLAERDPKPSTTTGGARPQIRVPSKKAVLSSAAGTQPVTTPKVADRPPTADFADAKYPENWNLNLGMIALIRLSSDGTVDAIDIKHAPTSSFDDEVRRAIKSSKFTPAYRDGKAIESTIQVTYRFDPQQRTGKALGFFVVSQGSTR